MAKRAGLGGFVNGGDVCWYAFKTPDKKCPVLVLTGDFVRACPG